MAKEFFGLVANGNFLKKKMRWYCDLPKVNILQIFFKKAKP